NPGGLVVGRDERQPTDLQKLRGREEDHLWGKPVDRIDERALLEHLIVEPALPGGYGRRETRWSRSNDDEIPHGHMIILSAPSPPSAPLPRPHSSPCRSSSLSRHSSESRFREVARRLSWPQETTHEIDHPDHRAALDAGDWLGR